MTRGKLVWGLLWLTVVCAFTFGCGEVISTTVTTPDTGGLVIFVGDSPLCDVLSLRTTITGMQLESTTDGKATNPYKGVLQPFVKINFAGLRDTTSYLRLSPVNVGTYDQAFISFGLVTFTFFDPSSSPPIVASSPSYSSGGGTFDIRPPITVTKGAISGLRVDFDVRHSLGVDAQGRLTGNVPPAITFSALTPDSTTGFGRLQDLRGFVLSVTSGSTLTEFLGSINVQLHSGTSSVPQVAVNISPSTTIITADYPDGVLATTDLIGRILGGSFVEIDGYVDSRGNMVATTVNVEDQENVVTRRQALIGTITSVTRDPIGNATELEFYVAEEQPESVFNVQLDSIVRVNLTSTTKYYYSSREVNFASLPFDASAMAVGQHVIVHGPSIAGTPTVPTTVNADSVYLSLQTHDGNFSSLVDAGSDDRTGAFRLNSCETIFNGSSILVFTNNNTSFVNVVGLSGLTSQPTLGVKGLLFYVPYGTTINGITVPAGTLVMLADEVHALT